MRQLHCSIRSIILIAAFAMTGYAAAANAAEPAQFPTHSVRILVGFSPGGGVDTMARALATRLTQSLGQPVVVENRPGANGNISANVADASPADGYTILFITVSHAISQSLYAKLNYSLEKDFSPLAYLGRVSQIIVVNPQTTMATMDDFLAQAKAHPGSIRYGTSGIGSGEHIAGAMLEQTANIKLTHVPYKGGSEAMVAAVGGSIESSITTLVSASKFINSGSLRPLAVTSLKRSSHYPQLPTVSEATGNSGYEMYTWYGAVVKAGTPEPIVKRLNAALNEALRDPETKKVLDTLGIELTGGSPEEFGALIKSEVEKFARVIKAADVKIN